MARKIFISYKYDEASRLRDRIISSLGEDAQYYRGETSDSPNLADLKTQTIKKHLADMIFSTSVTIVIISPNMKKSNWIPWEIQYSLTEYARNDRTSRTNGIVAVVMKVNGSYGWFINQPFFRDLKYRNDLVPLIISENRENRKVHPYNYYPHLISSVGVNLDDLPKSHSYISYITEEDFLLNPDKYIEQAYSKALQVNEFKIEKRSEVELNRRPLWMY